MAVKIISNRKTKSINDKYLYQEKPITDIITIGFFTVDHKWTVTYWNKAAETILGVKAKDIIGKNLWAKFAASIPLDFYAVYHKAFLHNIPLHFEEYWGEMGAWFDVITYYCENSLSVSFKSSNYPPQSRFSMHVDQDHKIFNELNRFVPEVKNDCLWEWDFKTKELIWIDGGHKRIFGYPVENALIPQSFWESRLHPEDKSRVLTKLNKIIRAGVDIVWKEEYRFERSNGDYAYVEDLGHIIYDVKKRALRMVGSTRDITKRKLEEIQFLEIESKLSMIARQAVNAVIVTDSDGNIEWVNDAFTRITEYKPAEVIGRKPGSFLQGKETDQLVAKYLREQIKDKLSFDCEIVNYSKSGRKYWAHIQGQALYDETGACNQYFAMQTDITEKVLLKIKLQKERIARQIEITDAVITAQENERADISKQLYDNLNQILGATKLYIEMAKTHKKNREMCLNKSSGYIVNVIEEIRRISKTLAPPRIQFMGLTDSIKILVQDLKMLNRVKIEFHENGLDVENLSKKLQLNIFRIVQEHLNNILKHSRATFATINLSVIEDEIILVISDNGQGCDLLQESKGIGLLNIKSRTELYHGRVLISAKPGEGYELKVVFRLSEIV